MADTMDDILSEKPAAPEAPEVPDGVQEPVERPTSRRKAHAAREAEAQGKVRDPDTGQFRKAEEAAPEAPPAPPEAPKAEAPAAPAVPAQPEFTEREKAFLRQAQDERNKRQELERKAAAPKEEPKTFWDDPEGALARQKQETDQALLTMRLTTAETIARGKHADFDAKIEVFKELLMQTPGLGHQWLAAADPAEFAYNLGKTHMELKQAGSIDQLRAQIEKETRLKVEAEYADKAKKLEAERAALPPSLTNAHATAAPRVVWGGPTSMTDILKS